MSISRHRQNLIYILTGTIIEHLDSMLFALYIPVIATCFFPKQEISAQWYFGFLAFSLYFIVRPFGALFFGMIGDAYGRKKSLLLSMTMMSFATLGIGLLPSYANYGVYATVLFLLLRIIQGFSVGGEYGTAMTYIFENTSIEKQLFNGALLISTSHIGGLIASICGYLSPDNFRLIFIIAGIIGIASLKGRMMLSETYIGSKQITLRCKNDMNVIVCNNYISVFAASSCLIFIFYTITIYFNKIIMDKFHIELSSIFTLDILVLLICVMITPLLGFLSDRFFWNHLKIMRVGSIMFIFIGLPLIVLAFNSGVLIYFIGTQLLLTAFHMIFCMPTPKMICAFFAKQTRNTHVAFGYSFGVSVTAAFMPTINNFVYYNFGFFGIASALAMFSAMGYISTFIGAINEQNI